MKIVVCEDQKILLDGLVSSLGKEKSIEIVGTTTNASELLSLAKKSKCDLILTDIITENKTNALDEILRIKQELPQIKIVAITGFPDITFMEKAKKVGVNSFVYKNISTEELLSVIKSTFSGYSVFPNNDKTNNIIFSSLSETELKIIKLYCSGLERDEIAKELFISKSTLKAHITSILQKTGLSSIARVAIYAVSSGLIFAE